MNTAEISRRAALFALVGVPAGLAIHRVSQKLGCEPRLGATRRGDYSVQARGLEPVHGIGLSSSSLTLEQAIGYISLHGLRISWASLRTLAQCVVGEDDCIGDVQSAVDNLQAQGCRSFHIFGSMTIDRMREIQNALLDPNSPPAIVSIDQEGGIVNRFGWIPDLRLISAGFLARAGDPALAEEAGYITGQLLHLNGINLNFAPFVDLHAFEPARRFSGDPEQIAIYAGAFVRGMLRTGVGACAKHFPDGTAENSHFHLGRVDLPRRDLRVAERYQPLIAEGLPAIMVGHDIFTQVDPHNPASLSYSWITDILRREMGFNGVIVTDALGMLGLREEATYADAILRAFKAGADLLLADAYTVRTVLLQAVERGEVSRERVFESAVRIRDFSKRFPIVPPEPNKAELERPLMRQARDLYQRVMTHQPPARR